MGWPEVCRPNQPIFVKYLMLGISNFFNCIADVAISLNIKSDHKTPNNQQMEQYPG